MAKVSCALVVLGILACVTEAANYQVIVEFPHNSNTFTQGLIYNNDGTFYESAGRRGESALLLTSLSSGFDIIRTNLNDLYFAEGITLFGDEIFMLTWEAGVLFKFDAKTLDLTDILEFQTAGTGEGWGLTDDGVNLIVSDGGSSLSFVDPATLEILYTKTVTYLGQELILINELEYVNGIVWANTLDGDKIYAIDPATGRVQDYVNLSELIEIATNYGSTIAGFGGIQSMNGIAYNKDTGHFYVTGKYWPVLFEIDIEGYSFVSWLGSCAGKCGGAANTNSPTCHCDSKCDTYGDCCPNYAEQCVIDVGNYVNDGESELLGSCADACGGESSDCWCDDACAGHGDCCGDYNSQCEAPVHACTEDTCGGISSGGVCHCDDSCSMHNDCCLNYFPVCTEVSVWQPPEILDMSLSCVGKCGDMTVEGQFYCFCDNSCAGNGDCCLDKLETGCLA